jgi:enoyl-CoA hydratase/carnithine racemase
MAEPETTVLLVIDGAIATVTMNRPERRNSIAGTMMADMNRTLTILGSTHPCCCAICLR